MTTSPSPDDIDFAYRHHANAYVRKPNGFMALAAVAEAIRDFWIRTATLPAAGDASRAASPGRGAALRGRAGEALELGRGLGGQRRAVLDQRRGGVRA